MQLSTIRAGAARDPWASIATQVIRGADASAPGAFHSYSSRSSARFSSSADRFSWWSAARCRTKISERRSGEQRAHQGRRTTIWHALPTILRAGTYTPAWRARASPDAAALDARPPATAGAAVLPAASKRPLPEGGAHATAAAILVAWAAGILGTSTTPRFNSDWSVTTACWIALSTVLLSPSVSPRCSGRIGVAPRVMIARPFYEETCRPSALDLMIHTWDHRPFCVCSRGTILPSRPTVKAHAPPGS